MMVELPLASYWHRFLQVGGPGLPEPVAGWFYLLQPGGELQISLWALAGVGLLVGLLTGFFGLGGSFLLTPWLNLLFGVPYNVAVGTDLTQMIGTATLAGVRQGGRGYIDYRLGLLLFSGSIIGIEVGARILRGLTLAGSWHWGSWHLPVVQAAMTVVYGLLLGWIGSLIWREARTVAAGAAPATAPGGLAAGVSHRLRTLQLRPFIALPTSGVEAISLWVIILVGFGSGLLTGLLGVSGSFIRMPALIYVLGVPTVVSLGTNLFELFLTSCYGALSHGLKGNVELTLVAVLLLTTIVGSHLGGGLRRYHRPRLQQAFAGLIFLTLLLMVGALSRGW